MRGLYYIGLVPGILLTLLGDGLFIMLGFPNTCTRYVNYCYGIEPASVRVLVSTFSLALGSMGIVVAIGSLRRRCWKNCASSNSVRFSQCSEDGLLQILRFRSLFLR